MNLVDFLGMMAPITIDQNTSNSYAFTVKREYNQKLTGTHGQDGNYTGAESYTVDFSKSTCSVNVTVTVATATQVSKEVVGRWTRAVADAWNNRAKVCCSCSCREGGMPIVVQLVVTRFNIAPDGMIDVIPGGDAVDADQETWPDNGKRTIAHEIGHYLGNTDEYGTVNGVTYFQGRTGFMPIMNNPENAPSLANYQHVVDAINAKLPSESCKVVQISQQCSK